jgi:hypothetical protein
VGRSEESLADTASELGARFSAGDVNDGSLFPRVAEAAGDRLGGLMYAVGTITLRRSQGLTAERLPYQRRGRGSRGPGCAAGAQQEHGDRVDRGKEQPEGGAWNYDVENRERLRRDISVPRSRCSARRIPSAGRDVRGRLLGCL